MSFLDRIKSLFSGSSQRDDDRAHHQLQSPTQPESASRQPTEAEIAAAAAAAPLVAPVDPHAHVEPGLAHVEPGLESVDDPRYEGSNGQDEAEPLHEGDDRTP
jgi:hypothetical protein